jgi:hypothetical protein
MSHLAYVDTHLAYVDTDCLCPYSLSLRQQTRMSHLAYVDTHLADDNSPSLCRQLTEPMLTNT